MEIKRTTDYRQFRLRGENRKVVPGLVNRLVESIRKHNMLQANPIIVNRAMEVIDGQHRLAAAKILETPIYYVMVEPASLEEIQLLNVNVRSWNAKDFLHSYIAQGKQDYILLKKFIDKYQLPFTGSLVLLTQTVEGGSSTKAFREGRFEVEDYEWAEAVADEIVEMRPYLNVGTIGSSRFYRALMWLVRDGFKLYELTAKLKETGAIIYPSNTKLGYFRQIEDIMNKGRTGRPYRFG